MMELGEDSIKEHQAIADLIKELGLKNVYLVGGDFEKSLTTFNFLQMLIWLQHGWYPTNLRMR